MKYTTLLFDLDGTLLDTLSDLHLAVFHALHAFNMPQRSLDEVRMMVGNGIKKLIDRAVPDGTPPEITAKVLEVFRDYYSQNSRIKTAPYDGILAALKLLSGKGYKIAVISNKIDSAVKELNRDFFAEYIPVAIGDREGMRKKPAPDSLYEAMKLLGSKKEECIYIGDSDVDIETAQNAGIPCIGCAWGFRGRDFLRVHGLDDAWILEQPTEIPQFLETLEEKDIESV
ncbi:MAG: HAD family hydrolase [Clostridia bacterium]|nr:HAD family hydrolase [Clostridia bacterium]